MTVSEANRLKMLEDENGRLKKLLAEHMPDLSRCASCWQESGSLRRIRN